MEPPYILLKSTSWLPGDEWSTLLGAAVKNFWEPTSNSVPSEPLPYNQGRKFVEKGFNDFVLSKNDGRGKAAALKLKGLIGLTWKGQVDDHFDLQGKHIRYVKLRQLEKFWGAVKEDPDFKTTVPKWLGSRWQTGSNVPVCLITGLFICEDTAVGSSTESENRVDASVEAPTGTAASAVAASHGVTMLPSDGRGDLEAGFSASRTRQQRLTADDKGSSIFAMQLKIISSKLLDRQALRLQEKSPDAPVHRQMGEGDEAPSMDSLFLADIDYESFLGGEMKEAQKNEGAPSARE